MLSRFKIAEQFVGQENTSIVIPGFGMVPLCPETLTDDMAQASKEAGSVFFVGVEVGLGKKNDVKLLNKDTDGEATSTK